MSTSSTDPLRVFAAELERDLRARWSEPNLELISIERLGGGNSGRTYLVEIGTSTFGGRHVVRASTPGVAVAGPQDVGRQADIMAALHRAGLPTPAVHAVQREPVVAGSAYILLERIDGSDWWTTSREWGDVHVATRAIEVTSRFSTLAQAQTGIGHEPVWTAVEELGRWAPLFKGASDTVGAGAAALLAHLEERIPAAPRSGLVHGDFHYGNLLFRDGEIVGVLDWEIASLGPSLTDFGSLAVATLRRQYPEPNPTGDIEIPLGQLAELAGAAADEAAWFVAASCVKYSAIINYNLRLHRSGRKLDPVYEDLVATMELLLRDGRVILEGGLDRF